MLAARKILYVITGGIQATLAPVRAKWMLTVNPEIDIVIGVTPMALRFTTPTALSAFGRSSVVIDSWDDSLTPAHHVDLATWPDGVIVHPMTFDYLGKLAGGLGSGPVMLSLQATTAPIVLCPGFPPGLWQSPVTRENLRRVMLRPNVTVLPPVQGESAQSGETFVGAPVDFENAAAALAESLATGEATDSDHAA
ncbi:flavoprotein [Streptomyces sp. NPDC097640]|uniref:flavoprotein n=1 Tax=Streptomyces sp. NPDC097640 TaxID=3157229 RepID=UPI0033190807